MRVLMCDGAWPRPVFPAETSGVVLPDLSKDSTDTECCQIVLHPIPPAARSFYQISTTRAQGWATSPSRAWVTGVTLASVSVSNWSSSNFFKEEEVVKPGRRGCAHCIRARLIATQCQETPVPVSWHHQTISFAFKSCVHLDTWIFSRLSGLGSRYTQQPVCNIINDAESSAYGHELLPRRSPCGSGQCSNSLHSNRAHFPVLLKSSELW
jgi:hypothetical protein